MKKNFISFLKRNGAYTSYRKFVNSSTRNEIESGYISFDIINHSFAWRETKEGYGFWGTMAKDWTDYWLFYNKIC